MVIVLAHWAEHLAQAAQVYILGWPVPEARGVLGLWFPWLVKSEALHYGYALIMLVGLRIFRKGFQGQSYKWWMIAFWIQFWHHIEHALLQGQAIVGQNFFDSPVPVSIVQLWIPRVELHLSDGVGISGAGIGRGADGDLSSCRGRLREQSCEGFRAVGRSVPTFMAFGDLVDVTTDGDARHVSGGITRGQKHSYGHYKSSPQMRADRARAAGAVFIGCLLISGARARRAALPDHR